MQKYNLFLYFCRRFGLLAEWLGTGLQNRLLRFESGRDLKLRKEAVWKDSLFFVFNFSMYIFYTFAPQKIIQ